MCIMNGLNKKVVKNRLLNVSSVFHDLTNFTEYDSETKPCRHV